MAKRKVGIYYAYWTHDWDADFIPYARKVAKLGFDILEVNSGTMATMSSAARRELRDVADGEGIDLSYCIGLTADYDVASADRATRERGIDYLRQMAGAIGEMGGGRLSGIIYGAWPASLPEGETDKQPYFERSVQSMRAAAPAAEDNGVLLNVEVVNRFEQYLLNCAAEAVEYVKAVDSDAVRILLDTFHMNIEEDTIAGAVRTARGLLGHLHIGENNRKPPGNGHIPWDELGTALNEIDYDGYIVMEPFLMPGGEVGRDIKVFRDLSVGVDLDEEARKACAFVKEKLG